MIAEQSIQIFCSIFMLLKVAAFVVECRKCINFICLVDVTSAGNERKFFDAFEWKYVILWRKI